MNSTGVADEEWVWLGICLARCSGGRVLQWVGAQT